jgi:hypothetical protein
VLPSISIEREEVEMGDRLGIFRFTDSSQGPDRDGGGGAGYEVAATLLLYT